MTIDERIAESELQLRAADIALKTALEKDPQTSDIPVLHALSLDKLRAIGLRAALLELKETSEKPEQDVSE